MNPELAKRIKMVEFPTNESWERPKKPTQICLHHTASPNALGSINYWRIDNQPVSTPVVIDRDGTIYQIYSSMRWAFSLGLNQANRREVESATIGVEIVSWGYLTEKNGKYYSYTNTEISPKDVAILDTPYKGFKFYHKYTDAQIESTKLLLQHWGNIYGINLKYVGFDKMFKLYTPATNATESGVYSHNSFRNDKTDIFPQKEMIEMLKTL